MNRLELKALLIGIIFQLKNGMPLARNITQAKVRFKKLVGLPKNAKDADVLNAIGDVYEDNGIVHEFDELIIKFNIQL
jgi:hypothetical protein